MECQPRVLNIAQLRMVSTFQIGGQGQVPSNYSMIDILRIDISHIFFVYIIFPFFICWLFTSKIILPLSSPLKRTKDVSCFRGRIWAWSRNEKGCRLVQEALECLGAREAQQVAKELEGHVLEAATCPGFWWSFIYEKNLVVLPSLKLI